MKIAMDRTRMSKLMAAEMRYFNRPFAFSILTTCTLTLCLMAAVFSLFFFLGSSGGNDALFLSLSAALLVLVLSAMIVYRIIKWRESTSYSLVMIYTGILYAASAIAGLFMARAVWSGSLEEALLGGEAVFLENVADWCFWAPGALLAFYVVMLFVPAKTSFPVTGRLYVVNAFLPAAIIPVALFGMRMRQTGNTILIASISITLFVSLMLCMAVRFFFKAWVNYMLARPERTRKVLDKGTDSEREQLLSAPKAESLPAKQAAKQGKKKEKKAEESRSETGKEEPGTPAKEDRKQAAAAESASEGIAAPEAAKDVPVYSLQQEPEDADGAQTEKPKSRKKNKKKKRQQGDGKPVSAAEIGDVADDGQPEKDHVKANLEEPLETKPAGQANNKAEVGPKAQPTTNKKKKKKKKAAESGASGQTEQKETKEETGETSMQEQPEKGGGDEAEKAEQEKDKKASDALNEETGETSMQEQPEKGGGDEAEKAEQEKDKKAGEAPKEEAFGKESGTGSQKMGTKNGKGPDNVQT